MAAIKQAMQWTQEQLAAVLTMSQPAAGKIVNGKTKLKYEHAKAIADNSGFNLDWILSGEGDPGKDIVLLNENGTRTMTNEEKSIQGRFNACIDELMKRKGFAHYVQASDYLRLNNNHLTDVRNGKRPVSLGQLLNAAVYGDISSDYILTNRGAHTISDRAGKDQELQKRIDELERDKEMLQQHIDLLSGEDKRKTA